jgi:hypothetical protein
MGASGVPDIRESGQIREWPAGSPGQYLPVTVATRILVRLFFLKVWIYFQVNVITSFGQSLPFKRITVGSTWGGKLRVASAAERLLLKLGGRAPGCGRAWPALGGAVGDC